MGDIMYTVEKIEDNLVTLEDRNNNTLFDIDIALLTHDLIQNGLTFTYLIEEDGTELLVIVNKTSLLEKKLTTKFENKLTLDGYTYSKYKNCKIK